MPCARLPTSAPRAALLSGQPGCHRGHSWGSAPFLSWLALAPVWSLAAACSPLPEPRSPCRGSKAWPLPAVTPLSHSCRPGGTQKGVTVLFLYLPLCNKRPEPCSLFMSVSLPAGRSPLSCGGLCDWVSVQLQSLWGGSLSDHLGLGRASQATGPFLLAHGCHEPLLGSEGVADRVLRQHCHHHCLCHPCSHVNWDQSRQGHPQQVPTLYWRDSSAGLPNCPGNKEDKPTA